MITHTLLEYHPHLEYYIFQTNKNISKLMFHPQLLLIQLVLEYCTFCLPKANIKIVVRQSFIYLYNRKIGISTFKNSLLQTRPIIVIDDTITAAKFVFCISLNISINV